MENLPEIFFFVIKCVHTKGRRGEYERAFIPKRSEKLE